MATKLAMVATIDLSVGNHGCSDFLTVRFESPGTHRGEIIAVNACFNDFFHCPGEESWTHASEMEELIGREIQLLEMNAAQFCQHMMDLEDESVGKLAEDGQRCTNHWCLD